MFIKSATVLDFENMIMFEYVASIPGAFSKQMFFEQQVNAVDETFAGQMHQKRNSKMTCKPSAKPTDVP